MASLTSSFSPSYPSYSAASRMTSTASPSLDLRALVEWFMAQGNEALKSLQDLIESMTQKCLELYFRPAYAIASPDATLNAAEIHEAVAKEVYIEHIGLVLNATAANRLRCLADTDHGWNGSDAEAMSIDSLATFHAFIKEAGRFASDFGFFLGYEGEILINWTSRQGDLIDMAFHANRVELSSDTEDLEFEINDPKLYQVISSKYCG
ncbi:hypothetical protein [Pseudomonas putida]|uniref:hypothetical protein n=1 Tax=Pseudomonas putida TaxID=303 RepID=UPI00064C6DD5|nr:hypothetical protein [Pseudomonas putida]